MNNRVPLLLHILLLVFSLFVYFWSDRNAFDVNGPTSMVSGPDKTIVILIEDRIIRVTGDGDILSTLNFNDMGITEPIADLFVEPNGEMLIGLMNSQLIRRYSPDGKLLETHSRPPSAVGTEGRNFKFTKDPRSGLLYVADSEHHRVQIYGPDEQEQRVITSHGTGPAAADPSEEDGEEGDNRSPQADIAFRYPNALEIDNGRLYVTDTHNHQIVVFGLDGSFQRTFPTVYSGRTDYRYPVQFSVNNDTLYVINRSPQYSVGGEVIAIPMSGPGAKQFYPPNSGIDPLHILAREDDVLIADGNSKKILRYFPDGVYRGYFGKEALLAVLSDKAKRGAVYKVVRIYSLAGMLGVLVSLLFLKRRDRKTREQLGLPSEHQPIRAFQEILGPEGSRRRELLLVLVPGLGHMAAGRDLRAFILVPILLLCIAFFVICLAFYILNGVIYLWLALAAGLVTVAAWAGIVLDGKRLNESAEQLPRKFDPLTIIITFAVPFITAASGAVAQLMREKFINQDNPGLALAMQGFFQKVMIALHFMDKPGIVFAAIQPATLFLGWGGATAGLFGAVAWKCRQGPSRVTLAAAVGFVAGMISWVLTATFPAAMLGGAYYMPLSQGLLVSAAVYLYFRREIGSALIIPAGIVGAWVGGILHLFYRFPLPFVTLPGASVRTTMVVFQAYFIHLAIQIAMNVLEKRRQNAAVTAVVPA